VTENAEFQGEAILGKLLAGEAKENRARTGSTVLDMWGEAVVLEHTRRAERYLGAKLWQTWRLNVTVIGQRVH
jgi:hypothetical protein